MIQQRMHHLAGGTPAILISQASFLIGWEWKDKDNFGIDVTPNSMDWTVTIEDTGDGTAWISCVPNSGSGDRPDPNMYMSAAQANDTGLDRYADVRFSDDSGDADDVVIEVMQEANPE